MKKLKAMAAALLAAATVFCCAACGEKSNNIKEIDNPGTTPAQDDVSIVSDGKAVEQSPNVNGKRFNMTLREFTVLYNETKTINGESELIHLGNWRETGDPKKDDNGVEIQYWHYDDPTVSFTATVELKTGKLLNIGCGTTVSKFMGMTDEKNNSDIILGKAALMAKTVCRFPDGSEPVLQDIFFQTTTGDNDSLWYNGFVFNLSTKEDSSDSKNDIMLFRVFPVTDKLKEEWKLEEYGEES